jgi:predicted permease
MAFKWRRKPHDFADEIQSHLDLDADQLVGDGAQPREARAAAMRRFGNVTAAQERFYESGRLLWMDRLLQDIRGAARALRRYPVACTVAVGSLAAGIGSAASSLAIRDTMFRNPPPLYRQPDRLSAVFTLTPRGFRRGVPAALYGLWTMQHDLGHAWAGARAPRRDDVRADDRTETLPVRAVTSNLFSMLGVRAALGWTFDERPGKENAPAVLSHRAWQTLFDGRPDVIGRTLWIAERPHIVVGVMPERFWFEEIDPLVWTELDVAVLQSDDSLSVIVRRPASVSTTALRDSLAPGLAAYVQTLPQDRRALRANVDGVGGTPMGRQMSLLFPYLLGGCVVLTWLISCANVSILMIAQWTAREHEIGIRASLGASRTRVVRLLLFESLLVAICGGVLGICATFALRGLILRNAGPSIALFDTAIHADVLLQTAVATVLTGLLVGLAPALYETRRLHANPLSAIVAERGRARWRHALVIAEIAATVALLVVTGSMIDGYRRSMSAEMGFPNHSLLAIRVENPESVASAQILELVSSVPGVTSVAAATSAPWVGAPELQAVALDAGGTSAVQAEPSRISPTFFGTLGVPMQAGRAFGSADTSAGAAVAIVNHALAARLLPGRSPIGERIWLGSAAYTVVGVVPDYLQFPLSRPIPAVFLPLPADGIRRLQFVLRAPIAPAPLIAQLRRDIRRVGAGHAVASAVVFDQLIAVSGQEILAGTYPLVPLITIGIVLTIAGVYAVLALAVARRSRELALRIAIGATARDILRLVTARSASLVSLGATLGVAFTFALSRVARAAGGAGSMYDTPAWPAFVVPVLMIAAVSALATLIPSRRALRINPAALLRVD